MNDYSIKITGPFFARDVQPVIEAAVRDGLQDAVERGELLLKERARPKPAGVFLSFAEAQKGKASRGNYSRNINGRVDGEIGRISDGQVVYGPWLEGVSSRNETTRFKGYHSFRIVAQQLQNEMPDIMQAHIGRAVKGLN